ncbi:MAG: hypothetical protein J6S85_06765 [Methanobrevibacter sp.]|nr:hypothetical protein [Methanobrevibacter sp.]
MEEYPHVLRIFYRVEGKKKDGAFDVKVSHSSQLIVNNTADCSEEISTEKHYNPEEYLTIYGLFASLPTLACDSEVSHYLKNVDGVRVAMDSFLPSIVSKWIEVYQIKEDFSNLKLVREQVNKRVKDIFNHLEIELEELE